MLAHLENAHGDATAALALADRCLKDPRTARAGWSLRAALLQRTGDRAAAQAPGPIPSRTKPASPVLTRVL
jgi:hypothetical protein